MNNYNDYNNSDNYNINTRHEINTNHDKKYKKISKLGSGSYGNVYKVKSPGGNDYAVKINSKNENVNFSFNFGELCINSDLMEHPFIIEIKEVNFVENPFINSALSPIEYKNSSNDKLHFLFPLAIGDLKKYFATEKEFKLDEFKLIAVQILLALEYMHGRDIIHRDVKPDNILVFKGSNQEVTPTGIRETVVSKFGDFGFAKNYMKYDNCTPDLMSMWFRPPEVFLGADYDKSADIWSIGCTIYEMINGDPIISPQDESNQIGVQYIINKLPYRVDRNLVNYMNKRNYKFKYPTRKKSFEHFIGLDDESIEVINEYGGYQNFKDLILGLLQFDPSKRWTATEALDCEFLSELKPYIDKCRREFPAKIDYNFQLNIARIIERDWATSYAYGVFNDRKKFKWYKHKILFLSLDLIERVLKSLMENEELLDELHIKKRKIVKESNLLGNIMDKESLAVLFTSIIYISMKYYDINEANTSFDDIIDIKFRNKKNKIRAGNFEEVIIDKILKYKIFRPNIFYLLCNDKNPSITELNSCLCYIINGHYNNMTLKQAYRYWRKHIDYYNM